MKSNLYQLLYNYSYSSCVYDRLSVFFLKTLRMFYRNNDDNGIKLFLMKKSLIRSYFNVSNIIVCKYQ